MTRAVEPGRDAPARILRFHQVQARTGLSRSTIYRRLAGGSFPKPLSLGARAVGWAIGRRTTRGPPAAIPPVGETVGTLRP